MTAMQVLVVFYSRTGNTRRPAQEIAKGVRQVAELGKRCRG
jgi:flavodoxin